LSSFYLEIGKDRLYTLSPDNPVRRSTQTILYTTLNTLVRLCAPILAFTTDEVWQYMPESKAGESVHLHEFVELPAEYENRELAATWDELLNLRRQVLKVLEGARQEKVIGNSLEARVELKAKGLTKILLERFQEQLADIFIVSQVTLEELAETDQGLDDNPDLKVEVRPAAGDKCNRCWCYSEELTPAAAEFPEICPKCLKQLI
jgi:isoleucyl-tRNA synthetase